MTAPDPHELVERLATLWDEWNRGEEDTPEDIARWWLNAIHEEGYAIRSTLDAPQGEPVAWLVQEFVPGATGTKAIYLKLEDAEGLRQSTGGTARIIPLYAHPPASARGTVTDRRKGERRCHDGELYDRKIGADCSVARTGNDRRKE